MSEQTQTSTTRALQRAHGRLGIARRHGVDDTDARRDVAAARIAEAIDKVLTDAPPLTNAQRSHLAGMLDGAGDAG